MLKKLFIMVIFSVITFNMIAQESATFIDPRDGRAYRTIKIDTLIWMAENLAYKADKGSCWAYDNDSVHVKTYGYLYSYESALKACPAGWRLPSDSVWTLLSDYLRGKDITGKKLKSDKGWNKNIDTIVVRSGFDALAGGFRWVGGTFGSIGEKGFWWSSTETGENRAVYRSILSDEDGLFRWEDYKDYGLSVRCVKY
ncbi:MAG: FISUMP domain-containing protein [Bacteroidota bacterium]